MRLTIISALALATACASTPDAVAPQSAPMMASLSPVAPPPRLEPPSPGARAGALLELALQQFRVGERQQSSSTFNHAIETGRLNDAGRALAYWHIFVAERQVGNVDASTNALSSFIVVAEDIFAVRREMRYAVDETGDFADRFALQERLEQARALLSATWAERSDSFGRSEMQPVPVRNESELDYFLAFAAPCEETSHRSVNRRAMGSDLEKVSLTCGDASNSIDFFFDRSQYE